MVKLTSEEKGFIRDKELMVDGTKRAIALLDEVRKFKVGDFLIAYQNDYSYIDGIRNPITNSYGAIKKFIVVITDKHGVPYMKELNKDGKPTGYLISPISYRNFSDHRLTFIFQIDPGYEDAIILDDQDGYKPSGDIKMRSDTFKEIATYNKTIRKKFKNQQEVVDYLNSLKVGDTIWRSNSSCLSILDIKPVPTILGGRVKNDVDFLKTKDQNGKEKNWTFAKIKNIAFYTDRPRTFNELKDPK